MASSYNITTRSKRKLEKVEYNDRTLREALNEHRAEIERGVIRITNWNVSNVTYMQGLFYNWGSFNQPLNWDTSKVKNMAYMFSGCTKLNQPLLLNTSGVTSMAFMFNGCVSLNQDLEWDTSSVTNMESMFSDCAAFNRELRWDTSNVKIMSNMFERCAALEHKPVFDMSGEPDTDGMFEGSKVSSVVNVNGGLMRLRLSHGRRTEWTDNGNSCGICLSEEPRVVVHEPEPAGSTPHAYCGRCIENHIIAEWNKGDDPKCPGCRAPFHLWDLQKTAFGRCAMKVAGHKQRADVYRKLHRSGLADAHDAHARAYALGAARILRRRGVSTA
jgi:surface protein